jgi:hypothetical protein
MVDDLGNGAIRRQQIAGHSLRNTQEQGSKYADNRANAR